jgi:hypothetical protein
VGRVAAETGRRLEQGDLILVLTPQAESIDPGASDPAN